MSPLTSIEPMTRLLLTSLLLLPMLLSFSGCALDIFHDAITTELEVPRLVGGELYQTDKRFRFERDVVAAESAVIDHSWVELEHGDVDLSSLSRVRVFVVDPASGEQELLVEGGGFLPGQTFQRLEVQYKGDVRRFIEDNRVELVWEVEPNRLFQGWEEADSVLFGFGIVLEIDTP